MARVIGRQVAVGVPFSVAVDLDKTDSAFDQAAGEQALGSVRFRFGPVQAVHLLGGLGFPGEIRQFGGFCLHAVGEFKGLDAAEQFRLIGACAEVFGVDLGQQIQLSSLVGPGHIFGAIQVEDRVPFGAEEGPLIGGGEKASVPVEGASFDPLVVPQHDVAGQVLIFAPQAVCDPRSGRREAGAGDAGVDLVEGGDVVVGFAVQRFDERKVIDVLRDIRILVADPRSGLSVLLELEGRFHQRAGIAVEDVDLNLLAIPFGQFGLGVEGVHRTGGSFHEQPDD